MSDWTTTVVAQPLPRSQHLDRTNAAAQPAYERCRMPESRFRRGRFGASAGHPDRPGACRRQRHRHRARRGRAAARAARARQSSSASSPRRFCASSSPASRPGCSRSSGCSSPAASCFSGSAGRCGASSRIRRRPSRATKRTDAGGSTTARERPRKTFAAGRLADRRRRRLHVARQRARRRRRGARAPDRARLRPRPLGRADGHRGAFIARLLSRYRWIAYVGLAIILYVALRMIWEGAIEMHDAVALRWRRPRRDAGRRLGSPISGHSRFSAAAIGGRPRRCRWTFRRNCRPSCR